MTLRFSSSTLVLFLVALGCSSTKSTPTDTSTNDATTDSTSDAVTTASDTKAETSTLHVIDMFSWWVAPGEAQALQALITDFNNTYPNVAVFNEGEGDKDIQTQVLQSRLAINDPPDIYQDNAQTFQATMLQIQPPADAGSADASDADAGFLPQMTLLDNTVIDATTRSAYFPEVLANITYPEGSSNIYATPVDIHRENTLYYNVKVFSDAGVTAPPTTGYLSVTDFFTACASLKAAGKNPVAMGNEGWIVRIAFNELLIGELGATTFQAWANGTTTTSDQQAGFTAAISDLENLLDNYTNPIATTADGGLIDIGWTDAADMLHSGAAAMYLHGNWVTGYLVQGDGWTPGTEFMAVTSPGSGGLFAFDLDVFDMPMGGKNPTDTKNFLTTIELPQTQVDFSTYKGSSPVRSDISDTLFSDDVTKNTYHDLKNATVRMLMPTRNEWDNALGAFAISPRAQADQDTLYQVFIDNPPL